MRGVQAVAAVAVAVVLGSGGLAGAAVTPAGSPWTVQPTPLLPKQNHGALAGVSCTSAGHCVAVGGGVGERWNGTKWAPHRLPGEPLNADYGVQAVSCPAQARCVAVGFTKPYDTTVAMSWNGISWTIMPGSEMGGVLRGVSCVSASDCTAVGYGENASGIGTLAMSWNGSTWTVEPTPTLADQDPELDAVSCGSATSCLAIVGSLVSGLSLAEAWDGSAWTVLPTPPAPPGATYPSVSGVSCPSAAECMTVGAYENSAGDSEPLADLWNGSAWVLQTVPAPKGGYLYSVSCPAAMHCTAIGGGPGGMPEGWNGTRWTRQPGVPRPPGSKYGYSLNAVSCTAARTREVVGAIDTRPHSGRGLLPFAEGE